MSDRRRKTSDGIDPSDLQPDERTRLEGFDKIAEVVRGVRRRVGLFGRVRTGRTVAVSLGLIVVSLLFALLLTQRERTSLPEQSMPQERASAAPEPERRYQLWISRGSFDSVLEHFAQQTGLHIGTLLHVVESDTHELGSFSGEGTADEILTALLKGTDLSYVWLEPDTIGIYSVKYLCSTPASGWHDSLAKARSQCPDKSNPKGTGK